MSRKNLKGFTLIEMFLVLAVAVTLIGLSVYGLNRYRLAQMYQNFASQEATELAQIKAAAVKYVAANQASWRTDTRIEYRPADLIAAGFLPTDFAKRLQADGSTSVGTSPFGQPYLISSIKPMPDKIVRTVIYDNLGLLDARLARIGILQTNPDVLTLKTNIAGLAVANHKLIAGTVRVGETTATGYLNSFANFELALYMPAPGPTAVVALVGFPELGDSSTNPTPGGPRYTNCALLDGMSGCDHFGYGSTQYYACVQSGSGFIQPTCAAPAVDVRRWAPTGGFTLVDTPVGTLTTGADIELSGGGEQFNCGNGVTFTTTPTASRYAITTINNVTALRQLISKDVYYVEPGQSCPTFGTYNYYGGENVMCCMQVVQ